MEQTVNVPQKDLLFITNQVTLNLEQKTAMVYTTMRDPDNILPPKEVQKNVSFQEVIAAEPTITGAEVTAFKKILKAVVAAGWNKALANITVEPL